ncbi:MULTISPECIES: LysR substrate-binding domain-containing protein [unclassified Sinorhizobium]|uniref:LysR substrate-binding domain-containing protein n=1 Tax=unclassified Sinorhizobium TaxID=2613772 RepID=UPI0035257AED
MELKHLRYFIAVAEELHFTKAANRLNMSQPPLSQIINRLEENLGFKLFERTKRRVTLTDAGKILLQESRAILARADFAVENAARAARGDVGHLKVAFIPWADFTSKFSDLFRKFGEEHPDVTVDFHSTPVAAASAALIEGRVDVAILSTPPNPPPSLNGQLLLSDQIVVALPEHHSLARRKLIPLKLLEHEPQIVVAPDRIGSFYEVVYTLCQRAGFTLKPRHVIDHPQTTLALVSAGVGVSLVPSSYQNIHRPGIIYRPIEPTLNVSLIAAWKREESSPVVKAFLDVLHHFPAEEGDPT